MHLHHNLMALAAAGAIFLAPATSFADAASEAAQMAATPVQATDDSAAAQSAVGMPNPMVSAASYGELTEALDVHIRHLRAKLKGDENISKAIETVRGIGYRFARRTA